MVFFFSSDNSSTRTLQRTTAMMTYLLTLVEWLSHVRFCLVSHCSSFRAEPSLTGYGNWLILLKIRSPIPRHSFFYFVLTIQASPFVGTGYQSLARMTRSLAFKRRRAPRNWADRKTLTTGNHIAQNKTRPLLLLLWDLSFSGLVMASHADALRTLSRYKTFTFYNFLPD